MTIGRARPFHVGWRNGHALDLADPQGFRGFSPVWLCRPVVVPEIDARPRLYPLSLTLFFPKRGWSHHHCHRAKSL
jgi:hypothetical protein